MSEHICETDIVTCMALGRHPAPSGSKVDAERFDSHIRKIQKRIRRRFPSSTLKLRKALKRLVRS